MPSVETAKTVVLRIAVAASAAALIACEPAGNADRSMDSGVTAASARAREEAEGSLAGRDEAQPHLEAARKTFLANDAMWAADELRAAAEVSRSHAVLGIEPAKSALLKSAEELDALAVRVLDDGLSAVAPMDSAFARHHLAEAQLHCTRAEASWSARHPGVTAAEILMLVDHFERAARDVGYALTPAMLETLTTARSVAVMLSQTGSTRSPDVPMVLSRVDNGVHSLMARVGEARY